MATLQAEYEALRVCTADLNSALARSGSLNTVANKLVGKAIIAGNLQQNLDTLGVDNDQKASKLMGAVSDRIRLDPQAFSTYVCILYEEAFFHDVVNKLLTEYENRNPTAAMELRNSLGIPSEGPAAALTPGPVEGQDRIIQGGGRRVAPDSSESRVHPRRPGGFFHEFFREMGGGAGRAAGTILVWGLGGVGIVVGGFLLIRYGLNKLVVLGQNIRGRFFNWIPFMRQH